MHHLLPFAVLLLLLLRISSSHPLHKPFTKIYAFGDSFTDTGNYNRSRQNRDYFSSPPYGSTYFHHPAHRCSDGRLVVDFLAAALSLPFLPPYLHLSSNYSSCHGVNFAEAFSTSFDDEFLLQNIYTAGGDIPTTLSTQLKWFENYLEKEKGCRRAGPPECGEAMDGALFWVGPFGFIDYFLGLSSSVPARIIRQQSVDNVINFLQEILKKGAKHVFVQGVPPIGCFPLLLSLRPSDHKDGNGCLSGITGDIKAHNSLLEEKLQELRRCYPGAFISYVDVFGAHLSVVKDFKAYGFEEPFMVCCGAGGSPYNFNFLAMCGSQEASVACSQSSKYINWDGIHPTEEMNKRMAEMFFHGSHCRPSLTGAFLKSNGM